MRITQTDNQNNNKYFCKKCKDVNWLVECACGCGNVRGYRNKQRRISKFITNHHMNLDEFKIDQWGEKNHRYRGGVHKHHSGHKYILAHGNRHADINGYVAEHILVYEEFHKLSMLPWGIVHHIDHNKQNNKIENLQGMMRNRHIGHHSKLRKRPKKNLGDRICLLCDSIDTFIDPKTGYEVWYRYKEGFICKKCYKKNKK